MSKYGPPEHLYVDNGRDYRKVARGALRSCAAPSPLDPPTWQEAELDRIADTGFLARLGIAATHCIPHHPQSKCIERFVRTLHERYDKLWPTYTSGTPFQPLLIPAIINETPGNGESDIAARFAEFQRYPPPYGFYSQIARELGTYPGHVRRVFLGHSTSDRVARHIVAAYPRLWLSLAKKDGS